MPLLVCKRVIFYSPNDEAVFFEWMGRIKCVVGISGDGDEIRLKIKRRKISNSNLRDLIALFRRYCIDLTQLKQFGSSLTDSF
jgi:hypothetical protein